MAPEPDASAVALRVALARVAAGEPLRDVMRELYAEGVRVGRKIERRVRDPFGNEDTPTLSADPYLHQRSTPVQQTASRAVTVPAPPPRTLPKPLPRGVRKR